MEHVTSLIFYMETTASLHGKKSKWDLSIKYFYRETALDYNLILYSKGIQVKCKNLSLLRHPDNLCRIGYDLHRTQVLPQPWVQFTQIQKKETSLKQRSVLSSLLWVHLWYEYDQSYYSEAWKLRQWIWSTSHQLYCKDPGPHTINRSPFAGGEGSPLSSGHLDLTNDRWSHVRH